MKRLGFTLIELLIVVAIIGILAAIAIPNFLEAQVRATVVRIKADQRTLGIGLDSYNVDNNSFPDNAGANQAWNLWVLTTPIEYISSIDVFFDPFNERVYPYTYAYLNYDDGMTWAHGAYNFNYHPDCRYSDWGYHAAWGVMSWGPSQVYKMGEYFPACYAKPSTRDVALDMVYDPTNGTISRGYIMRFGGEISGIPQVLP